MTYIFHPHKMSIDFIYNQFDRNFLDEIGQKIISSDKFYILCHVRPDPDMIGGALALYIVLKLLNKDVEIYSIEANNKSLYFLPNFQEMKELNESTPSNFNPNSQVIFLDTGDTYYKYFPSWKNIFKEKNITIWNIDHHSDNQMYGDINVVHKHCSACSKLLCGLFYYWNILWTKDIATNLLAGILADTGNLMHDNTTPDTFRVVSFLISKGADLETCTKNLFNTTSLGKLKLWGRILKRIKWSSHDAVFSYATLNDLKETNTNDEDLSGDIMNVLLAGVKNSRYAIFIKEKDESTVKVSLRTIRDDINVQEIAKQFDGGGHPKASGFTLSGTNIVSSIPLLQEKL